jgi:brefeldin A-inhibited guanine nucleotide-exchange protein
MSSSTNIRSADMFLTRGLQKILTEKEIKKSVNAQLKKQCEISLADFKKESNDNKSTNNSQYIQIDDVEKYFLPFEMACKSKVPRIVETSLDCIQKLIAHGYLNESASLHPSSTITKQQFIQRITKTIYQCFEGPDIDDNVQLQIIKVI